MALMHSTMVPLGTLAVGFKLPGVDGKMYSLESFSEKNIYQMKKRIFILMTSIKKN